MFETNEIQVIDWINEIIAKKNIKFFGGFDFVVLNCIYKNKIIPGINNAPQIQSKILSSSVNILNVKIPLNKRNEIGAVSDTIPALFLFHS